LDDDTQTTLDDVAKSRGIGLATDVRELAESEARRLRRARIRAQSRAVGAFVASSPEVQSFYADWGAPTTDGEPR